MASSPQPSGEPSPTSRLNEPPGSSGELSEVAPELGQLARSESQGPPDNGVSETRESEVLDLAFTISLDEVKESAKPFEQAKARAAVLFGSTSAAMAFLVGSALRDLDRNSFNGSLLTGGIVTFVAFSVFAFLTLYPMPRKLYLNGLNVRDTYFRGIQDDVKPSHAWELARVKYHLIKEASTIADFNVAQLRKLRIYFLGMLFCAAATLTFWSTLVAYAGPKN